MKFSDYVTVRFSTLFSQERALVYGMPAICIIRSHSAGIRTPVFAEFQPCFGRRTVAAMNAGIRGPVRLSRYLAAGFAEPSFPDFAFFEKSTSTTRTRPLPTPSEIFPNESQTKEPPQTANPFGFLYITVAIQTQLARHVPSGPSPGSSPVARGVLHSPDAPIAVG